MYRAFEVLLDGALDAAIERGHLPAVHRVACRLEEPADAAFGDATCRVALEIGRRSGRAPEPIAALLVAHLADPEGWLDGAEAAGPGFVNVRVSLAYWREALTAVLMDGTPRPVLGRAVVANTDRAASARGRLVTDAVARLLAAAGHYVEPLDGGLDTIGDAPAVRRVILVGETAPSSVHDAKAAFARAGGRAGIVAALGVGAVSVRHRGRVVDAEPVLAEPAARFALLSIPAEAPAVLDVERLASDRVDNPWVVVRYALARIGRVAGRDDDPAGSLARLGEPERACLRAIGMQPDVRDLAARRLDLAAMAAQALDLASTFHRYYNRGAYAGRDVDPARRLLACGVARTLGASLGVLVPGGAGS